MMLDKIIAECGLVCPYDNEFISDLDKACASYFELNELNESLFSEWVLCYIKGSYSLDIKDFIEDYARTHKLDDLRLPGCVWSALTFYFIYIAIVDNNSDEEKAIYSCSLQNMLLACKGYWESLNFQDCLVGLYWKLNHYLAEYVEGDDDVSLAFISGLFGVSDSSLELDDENLAYLKSMGRYTWLYKLEHFVDAKKYNEEKNPFVRVLYFLDYWYKENPCIYFKIDIRQLMDIVNVKKYKSKRSLREVISSLPSSNIIFDTPYSKSSLIVRMVNKCKVEEFSFVDEKLTCEEFFVYLYYELLLEQILRINAGK